MSFQPRVLPYAYEIKTIDSHTMGEATRIVYDGFPYLPGNTMMEKKKYLMENYDFLRSALMLEPRGHRDMFGALLTAPVHEEADFGVIFMDSGGCLNMCGHGSIGTASMVVETGMIPAEEPYTEVVLDAPSGLIRTSVHVVDGRAAEVSILNVPAFLYQKGLKTNLPGIGEVHFDISFGGSFFALVNAKEIGIPLEIQNVEKLTEVGMALREKINRTIEIRHPYLDITTVDLVEFYDETDNKKANLKNCVIFGNAQVDRSPCGTGTSAKMAALYAEGKLKPGETFVYESITGSMFRGEIAQEVEINGRKGIIPKITGSAYITGINTWLLDDQDSLEYGFLLGTTEENPPVSIRAEIVRAAWELFGEKGYPATTLQDIVRRAGTSEEEFYLYFKDKDELQNTLGELFDQKYADLMVSMNPRFTQYEKLMFLNQELFGLIEEQVPFNLISHLYVTMEKEQQTMLDSNRFYYRLIPQIIKEGQKDGEFKQDDSPEDLADTYASLERGMIYDWCVKGGSYSLKEKSRKLLPIYLTSLLKTA